MATGRHVSGAVAEHLHLILEQGAMSREQGKREGGGGGDAGALLTFSFVSNPEPQPMGHLCHPHSGWVFPPQLNLSGKILS